MGNKSKIIAVYKIICTINNKIYIGSSINVYKRWHNHRYELNLNKHHSNYLQNAWNKYGKDYFKFSILEKNDGYSLIEREQFWMDYYKSYNPKFGFNNNTKAEGNNLRKWTKEQRKKYSASRKGKKASDALLSALSKSRKIGSDSNLSSIDENKVLDIINSINSGLTPNEVCDLYNVKISLVRGIYQRRTWKHVTNGLYIREIGVESQQKQIAKLTEAQVREIKLKLLNGESHLEIAKQYGVNRTTILDIKKNKTWKNI